MKTPLTVAALLLMAASLFGQDAPLPAAAPAPAAPPPAEMQAKLRAAYGYGMFTFGMYEVSIKKLKEARAAFDLAMQNNDKLGRPYFHRADLLCDGGDFTAAQKDYIEALKREPDFFFACYNLACASALEGDKANALSSIEEALRLGYNRFDKLEKDDDLKNARRGPEFAALLDKYRKQPVKQTATARFLLGTREEKLAMLAKLMPAPGPDGMKETGEWKPVADKALLDSDEAVRIGGMNLYLALGGGQEMEVLVAGLFDNNGDVNKFAASALTAEGDAAMPWLDAIIASDYKEAKLYAAQIKQKLEATKADEIKPDDTKLPE